MTVDIDSFSIKMLLRQPLENLNTAFDIFQIVYLAFAFSIESILCMTAVP